VERGTVLLKRNQINKNKMQLKRATRKQVKLRLGLSGASGFGKTYSALLLAYGMTNDWSKIAVIDTENESASLYSNLGDYNTIPLTAPFTPERYIEALKMCEDAGMEAIIIDSITHEWNGKGGCLDIQNALGGKYQDWAKVTPRHQAFIDAILQSKCHVLTSVRRKQDYDMTKDSSGKLKVEKVGTKEETREGFEYELTVNFEFINDKHLVRASKDRTQLFADQPEFIITSETGKKILEWCQSGKDPKVEYERELLDAIKEMGECNNEECLKLKWSGNKKFQTEPLFIKAKDKKKLELNPVTK
jgi:hypothetical protein